MSTTFTSFRHIMPSQQSTMLRIKAFNSRTSHAACRDQAVQAQQGPYRQPWRSQQSLSKALHRFTHTKSIDILKEDAPTYKIKEQPLGDLKPLRVIIVGAGVNGLNMLYYIQKHTEQVSCTTYEKDSECGGTWYENRYPGCVADDPCYHYQYNHSPNPSWNSVFAPAAEIKQYLQDFAVHNNFGDSIKHKHTITNALWSEDLGEWKLQVTDTNTRKSFENHAHVFIDASGIFNDWKWPNIKGLHSFQGNLIHTANWLANFNYHDRTVAVIGNGASGVQVLPTLQPDAKKLIHFIQFKTWIAPMSQAVHLCQEHTVGVSDFFSFEWTKTLLECPKKYEKFMSDLDHSFGMARFKTIINDSKEAVSARRTITAYMTNLLYEKPELIDALVPDVPVGCRRITSSIKYLPAMCILMDSGEHYDVGAIICATGFNTSFNLRFPIMGEGGVGLQDEWSDVNCGPRVYMSIMAKKMPNYFRFLGPNGPLAHGAIPRLSSDICEYILAHIQKLQVEHLSSVRPLPAAVKDFNEHVQAFMPRTAWSGRGCGGWYKGKKNSSGVDGMVTALHPGSQTHWEHMLKNVRWEDFEYTRAGGGEANRFAYLGNGFVSEELEEDQ